MWWNWAHNKNEWDNSSAIIGWWVLITLMYTSLLPPHLQMTSGLSSSAFCAIQWRKHPAGQASRHRNLDHLNNHFLCIAAWGVQAVKGQMCSTLNTLKAKKSTIDLFLQSKQHQGLVKLFHLGLKPLQLRESGDWSCTAQLTAVQLCVADSHTMLDYNCLHCTAWEVNHTQTHTCLCTSAVTSLPLWSSRGADIV